MARGIPHGRTGGAAARAGPGTSRVIGSALTLIVVPARSAAGVG